MYAQQMLIYSDLLLERYKK